jgi:hypothetical protein
MLEMVWGCSWSSWEGSIVKGVPFYVVINLCIDGGGGAGRVNIVGSWVNVARVDSRSRFPMLLFWWWIQRI